MVENIVTLVSEVVKCLAPRAELQLGYLRNYSANFENLKAEMQKLKDKRMSILGIVSEAERNVEKIEDKVENWLDRVEKIIEVAAKYIEDEETTNKRCFKGLCPNLKTRYQLSKKAEKEVKALVGLLDEARRFNRISYPTILEEIWLKSHKGYEAFESRLSTLKCIRNSLTDLNVSIIGVYGMGGIGKTKLVKEVTRQAKENMLFDQVVFSEVSQTPDIKKIQSEIAEKLGLVLHEEAESIRASRLYDRLKNEKKILVVLDNIWKPVDLENVGIPFGDDHKGCKILLTTRDRNVLLNMGSKDNFLIGNLNEEEAWRLFNITAGDEVESRKWKPIATDVAKACGGLPIAIVTIARALRGKDMPEWKNALQELQTPSMVNFEGVSSEAYSSIELSYKFLKGKLQETFKLCSLCESGSVSDLFKYGKGMGLFKGVNKLEVARNKLYAQVNELKNSCLLLEAGSSNRFSMHDVVRDVAISIACQDKPVFLLRNEDVWEWPDHETLKKYWAICLRNNDIHQLLDGLECPQLEFLYMSPKESFTEIKFPPNFFTGMRKLRVVDFTRMQLFSLPSSIEFLVNLQTLCLDQSKLGDITIIGKLKNLEVLSLLKSDFLQLPKEIGQLTKLRLLDLTACFKLKVIAPNVISNLTRLEEIYMSNCSVEWEVDGFNSERSNASLDELMHLSRLTTLEISVKNDNNLPEGFFDRKLSRFKIRIGDDSFLKPLATINKYIFRFSLQQFLISDRETLRTLKLKLNSTRIFSKKLQGIKNVEYLCLDKLQGVKNVLFDLDTEGFSQLKHLDVQNNPDFMCIVDLIERVPFDPFPLLESLTLYKFINLERICHYQLRVESFNELKAVQVRQCDALSNIFLLSTAKCLPRLQRIAVINCRNMKVLFSVGEENDAIEKIEFVQLSTLCLGNLPELTSFCCEVKTPSVSLNRQMSHEESTDITCYNEISLEDKIDTSSTLFNEKVVLPNLEALEMYEINVEKIWQNQLPDMFLHFQSLKRLILNRCHNLKYIFSASMVQSFGQLKHLEITNCKGLQEIISEEGADQETPSFVFPQLTTLILIRLPELRCLYPGMHTVKWPALIKLEVSLCDQIKIFTSESFGFHTSKEDQQPLFLFEKIFPVLEELGADGKGINMILQGDFPQHLFDRLKVLSVSQDDSAANFPLCLLERSHNLERLKLILCSYKEILSNGESLDKHVGKLAQIKHLLLYKLYDLKQLWKQDSGLDFIFQHLQTLRVEHCYNLSILLPSSSVSFQNLTELTAFGCKELKNLVTFFTAKGLVRLVKMQVSGCSAMTEVIKSEGKDAAKEEIVFSKLKLLDLIDLESLTSFCSSDYIFKFPFLRYLNVRGCPNMSIFTTGELSTPARLYVGCNTMEEERHWDGDLNTTIQNLHKKKLLEGESTYSTQY